MSKITAHILLHLTVDISHFAEATQRDFLIGMLKGITAYRYAFGAIETSSSPTSRTGTTTLAALRKSSRCWTRYTTDALVCLQDTLMSTECAILTTQDWANVEDDCSEYLTTEQLAMFDVVIQCPLTRINPKVRTEYQKANLCPLYMERRLCLARQVAGSTIASQRPNVTEQPNIKDRVDNFLENDRCLTCSHHH
jgi:hypothetical protein